MNRRLDESDLALVTVVEAAARAGVAVKTIHSWISRHGLTVWREPGQPMMLSEREVLTVERSTRRSRHARGGPSRQSER